MGKNKLSDETISEIVMKYTTTEVSLEKLGAYYRVSPCTISKYLKKRGIEIINRQNRINFDAYRDVLPLYNCGYSLTEISKRVGNSRQSIAKSLRKIGVTVVNRHNITKFNENVFDTIDTEEKAYWLGFIYADGTISSQADGKKRRYRFELCLKLSDIAHLEKFNDFMSHTKRNISTKKSVLGGKEFYSCRFGVTNRHLWETLYGYGCTPRKSYTLKFPDLSIFQDQSLVRHFLRGYFDGDGCITYDSHKSKDGKTRHSAISNVIGTMDFLTGFFNCIGFSKKHIKPLKKDSEFTFQLNFFQNDTQRLIEFLYGDCNVYLDRKYKRAMFFKHSCRSSEELEELLADEIGGQA